MSKVSTYLNFVRNTQAAFAFYKSVFETEYIGDIMRLGQVPAQPGQPPLAEEDKNLIMHIELPILGGHSLHGTDVPESMGFKVNFGNNVYIMLNPDTREETDKLFNALSDGAKIEMPMQDMFWGDYYGSLTDKFGVQWMFNCTAK